MNRKHPLILLFPVTLTFSFAPVAFEKVESVYDGDIILLNSGKSEIFGDGQNPPSNFRLCTDHIRFLRALGTNKVLDARRRGVPTEAYNQYAARRSDRRQRSSLDPAMRGDDSLMVDQGWRSSSDHYHWPL